MIWVYLPRIAARISPGDKILNGRRSRAPIGFAGWFSVSCRERMKPLSSGHAMTCSLTHAKHHNNRKDGRPRPCSLNMNKIASPHPSIIAIDGPAASGKSTIGLMLANALGYLFFDTGVMYRAITWLALERGIDVHDETAVSTLAEEAQIDVAPASESDGRTCDVFLNGQDITWETRSRKVDANVSIIAAYPGVRKALSQQQRRIGQRGNIVMVGRDIGTVVLPEADLKIYLDATAEERARRRHDEIIERNGKANYNEILERVIERDRIDSTRDVAPLKAADDAVVLNSDKLTADEVFEQVLALVK